MEQSDFLEKEAIRTPEMELRVHAVLAENAVLKEKNAELKERLAYLEKVVYGQKSEKTEVVLEGAEQIPMLDEAEQESDIHPKTLQTTEVKPHNWYALPGKFIVTGVSICQTKNSIW